MRDMFFDRQGQPITIMEWGELMANPMYKRVAESTLPDGTWISTVWMGYDHGWGEGDPVIFETMVFTEKSGESLEEADTKGKTSCDRYTTEKEALAGHQRIVEEWSK